ncbi:hypothetical protein BGLY_0195 [Bacillus glycinifermentans]|nr:hypothetical protein BGLY_0195 [Bacillus glycinifermentans]
MRRLMKVLSILFGMIAAAVLFLSVSVFIYHHYQ